MSPAVTPPGPLAFRYTVTGSSSSERITMSLMFRMMSVTSSVTLGIVENSCSTPSILTEETAVPGIEERSVLRREFPRVCPKPGSSGSIVKVERLSSTTCSWICGLVTISTLHSSFGRGSSTPPGPNVAHTRRRFRGRHPLCGTGVTSWMPRISRPVAASDRIAVSRPDPGPLT